MSVAFIFV